VATLLSCVDSAGADEPPPKKPPMAWPIDDPTATPLPCISIYPEYQGDSQFTQQCSPSGQKDPDLGNQLVAVQEEQQEEPLGEVGMRRWSQDVFVGEQV
jgi:hypothetical protein